MSFSNFNFESVNTPNFFIRHRNFLGELTTMDNLVNDFNFVLEVRDPVDTSLVSFSAQGPSLGKYFRHSNLRIKLEMPPLPPADTVFLFYQDSSFFMVPGLLGGPETRSFRSFNLADHYLRHRDFHLFVEHRDTPNLAADATFILKPAAVLIDP